MAEGLYRSRAARQIKHLVKFSGMGADSHSPSELLKLHAETDDILRSSGVPFTILQPNSFHQNVLSFANTIKVQGVFYCRSTLSVLRGLALSDRQALLRYRYGAFSLL